MRVENRVMLVILAAVLMMFALQELHVLAP